MFPIKLFKAWVIIPILTYIAVIPLVVLIQLGILPMVDAFGGFMTATCMLVFNVLFVYTARKLNKATFEVNLLMAENKLS